MLSSFRRLLLVIFVASIATISLQAQVVISQLYGGGGNSGATIKNDFIEIFNRGNATVSVTGWSVQYASSTGTSWQVTNLSGSVQAGQHLLIQEAAGAGGTVSLVPDVTGAIAMSATAGKVALLNSTTALTGACPTAGAIQDFVGYGTGTNCSETAVTPTLSNTTAALRLNDGCTDTNNNAANFSVGAPNPRNTSTALTPCSLAITNASPLPDATVGVAYSVTFTAANGTAPYSFLKSSGTFPAGLTLTGATLSGTPTTTTGSPFSFTTQVTDSASPTAGTAQKDFQITVKAALTGVGFATPGSLQTGNNTLLTVTVSPGSNPASTSINVVGDLSSIGGLPSQGFFDDGTHGDVTAGDNTFSFQALIPTATSLGSKSVPITITDAQSRTSNTAIALTIQPPPTVKISQVYGGGGNSGSTYTNDFIELFNVSSNPVDLSGWSVQYTSSGATNAWQVTNLCPSSPCLLQPGHYYLVQESAGAGGTTALPTADVVGTIPMGAGAGNVVLVASTTALAIGCHPGGLIVDAIGYGGGACAETAASATLINTTAAVRRGNGCVDTDNNANDFVTVGPIPRNNLSPANFCNSDPGQPSGLGIATPDSIDPAANTLLTVNVTPATTPASTNISVVANLTDFGGSATQTFYDDGTHGDQIAGDNTFSYQVTVGASVVTGAHSAVAVITDGQGRSPNAPITLTVQSPTCGVERWTVKVGTDPDAGQVDLNNVVRGNIADLGNLSAPPDPPGPPDNARLTPTEKTVFIINGLMTFYKLETDVDYHIVIQDPDGHTIITEIPSPACILQNGSPRVLVPGPFSDAIAAARAKFDTKLTAQTFFQTANLPVQIKGVGFFDFIHGQTGVAPNGIELHPVLDISFTAPTTTILAAGTNPSQYGQSVAFTATVSNGGGSTPTGHVSLFDGGTLITTANLDPGGQATFNVNILTVGSHSVYATYEGDNTSAESKSNTVAQMVSPAEQAITFASLGSKTFGDAPFGVSATGGGSGNPVTFAATGSCTSGGTNGSTITITGVGSCSVTASQAGNTSYNAAPDVAQSFTINRANANLTVTIDLSRQGDGSYLATLTIKNNGPGPATNVNLTAATLGAAAGSPIPQSLGLVLPNGATIATTVRFPASAGAPGAMLVQRYSGTYDGGTFSAAGRAVLPQ